MSNDFSHDMSMQVFLDQTFRPMAYPTWLEYTHGACNLLRRGFVLAFDSKLEKLPQLDYKKRRGLFENSSKLDYLHAKAMPQKPEHHLRRH